MAGPYVSSTLKGRYARTRHYAIAPLERVDADEFLSLIRAERYFVLHAPRQTGKTSALIALRNLTLYAMFVVLMGILAGCARTSTLPLAADRIEITVRVAPICSRDDADRLALQKSAVETIRSGFENFIVIDTGGGDYISGHTPTTAHTALHGNSATTTVSGGAPLVAHRRILTIQMFHAGESGGEMALSARAVLGSDWQTFATKGVPNTCFGGDG